MSTMVKRMGLVATVGLLLGTLLAPSPAAARSRPDVIELPSGFRPEGIASSGNRLFVGSIPTGDIFVADRRSGAGRLFVDAPDGRAAIGLEVDRRHNWLWVAGGPTGSVYVYDLRTGGDVAQLTMPVPGGAAGTFINDVQVLGDAAYATDSLNAVVYRIPVTRRGRVGPAQAVELGGDWQQVAGFNANGIVSAPGGRTLLIINSTTGVLYRVEPGTGEATAVTVEGAPNGSGTLPAGDGMFRQGNRLWVVQNRLNQVVEIELERRARAAEVDEILTDPDLDVPTTITGSGGDLYTVNARFGVPDPDTAAYQIVRLDD